MRQPSLDTLPVLPLVPAIGHFAMPSSSSSGPALEPQEHTTINNILRLLFPPTVRVRSIHALREHLHSLHILVLSNGTRLLLKGLPRPTTALLRRERSLLETEARALALLKQRGSPCIPQLFHYDSRGDMLGSSFLIRQYVTGSTLQDMDAQLTDQDRDGIDRHLGLMVNMIGQQIAPSFGPLEQVACGSGKQSWREAFVALFESVLRDAEDMFIHLPYSQIRHEMSRLAAALEGVTLPQLVVIDFGRPSQVLLDPESKQLSGIVDFGHALWGDVYMAEIFEKPSSAVLDGFGLRSRKSKLEDIRSLLYACYRSVHEITVQYYRDRDETTEINARRRLTAAIGKMASMDIKE
ncbi:hypothetical protein AWENTII_001261 [Aspergillus wentii]